MTKLKYKIILIILVLGFSINSDASEPTFKKEFTKEIHETFDVSPGVNLGIHNKYGDINISSWDKNKIQVDVLIKVKSSNSERAQKFLNEVKIDFDASSSKVIAKTIYPDQNNNSWWSNWFGNGKNLDYEVNYIIYAPVEMNSKLINKYGNISQTSIDGHCDVTNKYGDIFLDNITKSLKIDLGYGKAKVGTVGDSEVVMKYSSLKLVEANNLEISTKYSDIKIKLCQNMVAKTKYDEYEIGSMGTFKNIGKHDEFQIGTLDEINIDTKYTEVNIKVLNHIGIFDTSYGDVDILSTGQDLDEIVIESRYTDYEFNISGDFHLDFDGSHADLHVGQPYEKYVSEKDGSDLRLKAFRGSRQGGAQIKAYMKYGDLDID